MPVGHTCVVPLCCSVEQPGLKYNHNHARRRRALYGYNYNHELTFSLARHKVRCGPTLRRHVTLTEFFQFYSRVLHPKAFPGKHADHFFSNRTRSAIFQKPLLVRSDKKPQTLYFFVLFFFCPLKEGGLSARCLV